MPSNLLIRTLTPTLTLTLFFAPLPQLTASRASRRRQFTGSFDLSLLATTPLPLLFRGATAYLVSSSRQFVYTVDTSAITQRAVNAAGETMLRFVFLLKQGHVQAGEAIKMAGDQANAKVRARCAGESTVATSLQHIRNHLFSQPPLVLAAAQQPRVRDEQPVLRVVRRLRRAVHAARDGPPALALGAGEVSVCWLLVYTWLQVYVCM